MSDGAAPRRSAWLWVDEHAAADAGALARFARAQDVGEVFVSVPWPGPTRATSTCRAAFEREGVRWASLGGDPAWARTPAQAAEWARRAGGDGIHLDIEPWTLPTWQADAPALLDGLARAVAAVAAVRRPVDVDVPGWLAREHPVTFARIAGATDRLTILAYRDRSADIIAEARAAIDATRSAYRVAVDTSPSADAHTTFHGDGAHALARETDAVAAALRGTRFVGMAVHDLAGWRALRP